MLNETKHQCQNSTGYILWKLNIFFLLVCTNLLSFFSSVTFLPHHTWESLDIEQNTSESWFIAGNGFM